jgi:hypothetical protein
MPSIGSILHHSQKKYASNYHKRCKSSVVVGVKADNSLKVIPTTCKSWQCPECSPIKKARWAAIANAGKPNKFLTLTIDKKRFESDEDIIERLSKAWTLFIKAMRKQFGEIEYLRVYELQKNGNPHIHALIRCERYLPFQLIKKAWLGLDVGKIVHIKQIKNIDKAASYILKYMGKEFKDMSADFPHKRLINKSRNWLLENPTAGKQADEVPVLKWFFLKDVTPHQAVSNLFMSGGKFIDADNEKQVYDVAEVNPDKLLSKDISYKKLVNFLIANQPKAASLDIYGIIQPDKRENHHINPPPKTEFSEYEQGCLF